MTAALAATIVVLVAFHPLADALPRLENYQIRVGLRGFDDGVTRSPSVGVREVAGLGVTAIPSLSATCVAIGCEIEVPLFQHHWFDFTLHDLEGAPIARKGVLATFLGFEDGADEVRFDTDAAGAASILRRPAADPVVRVHLLLPDGSEATYAWIVRGETPDATQPVTVRGEGRVLRAEIEVLASAHIWIDQHAVVLDKSFAPASALVSDASIRRDGREQYAAVAYAAFSQPRDVELVATAAEVAAGADLPVLILNDATSSRVDVRGYLEPTIRYVAIVGRAGDAADAYLRVFGAPGTYRLTVTDVGGFDAVGAQMAGLQASVDGVGPALGRFEAALDVGSPGLVMTEALVPFAGAATATIARNGAGWSGEISEEERHFLDDGACEGAWRVSLDDHVGIFTPSVVIAHAEGYAIPAWARAAFPQLGVC